MPCNYDKKTFSDLKFHLTNQNFMLFTRAYVRIKAGKKQ